MKREEFISKINETGLYRKVFVKPNNYAGGPYFFGCFFDGNQWVVYENDERGKHEDLIRTLYEEHGYVALFVVALLIFVIGSFIALFVENFKSLFVEKIGKLKKGRRVNSPLE